MLQGKAIGILAREALDGGWAAEVMGVTSGGVFVRANKQRVLFVTYAPFHGPTTINLEGSLEDLRVSQPGQVVRLTRTEIRVPASGLAVGLNGAPTWIGELEHGRAVQTVEVMERLRRTAMLAADQKGSQGFAPVLRWLVGAGEKAAEGDLNDHMLVAIEVLREAIRAGDAAAVVEQARFLVGRGRGLTPSGDDFLAGILLVFNRWGRWMGIAEPGLLNAGLVKLGKEKTTSLSATIMHSASLGLADERISAVLDRVMLGEGDELDGIRNLVRMGHSSGVDTLVGMTVVIEAFSSQLSAISQRKE